MGARFSGPVQTDPGAHPAPLGEWLSLFQRIVLLFPLASCTQSYLHADPEIRTGRVECSNTVLSSVFSKKCLKNDSALLQLQLSGRYRSMVKDLISTAVILIIGM